MVWPLDWLQMQKLILSMGSIHRYSYHCHRLRMVFRLTHCYFLNIFLRCFLHWLGEDLIVSLEHYCMLLTNIHCCCLWHVNNKFLMYSPPYWMQNPIMCLFHRCFLANTNLLRLLDLIRRQWFDCHTHCQQLWVQMDLLVSHNMS